MKCSITTVLAFAATVLAGAEVRLTTRLNEVGALMGNSDRTIQDFSAVFIVDVRSPQNRTITVQQNPQPLSAKFVSGSTGEPFVALSQMSYKVKLSAGQNNLIAKVLLPYDPAVLRKANVSPCNTYVGKLSADGLSWVVNEGKRNVQTGANTTRSEKLTSLDGEYMLLGRQTVDTENVFVEYGFGKDRTVNVTGGQGRQEAEFIDGLRFSVVSPQAFGMNVDLRTGLNAGAFPAGTKAVNSFAWSVNTTIKANVTKGSIRFPVNRDLLPANLKRANLTGQLTVGRRDVTAGGATKFVQVAANQTSIVGSQVTITNTGLLAGQYVVLVKNQPAKREASGFVKVVRSEEKRDDDASDNETEDVSDETEEDDADEEDSE